MVLCLCSILSCFRAFADEPRYEIEFKDAPRWTELEKRRWLQVNKSASKGSDNTATSIRTAQPRAVYRPTSSWSCGPVELTSEQQLPTECDLSSYMAGLHRRFKTNWLRPPGSNGKRVTIRFSIHPQGFISHLGIFRSSGNASFDEAGLATVERSNPLPSLPTGIKNPIDAKFTFDDYIQ